jgi:hypothetical protein
MIVSLNEIESLSLKACRGAGMSWGLAEEAAQAARWLATASLPWDQSLARLLAQRHRIAEPSLSGREIRGTIEGMALCPILAGAAIADLIEHGTSLTLHDILEPIWLLPFAHRPARPGRNVVLTWPTGTICFSAVVVPEISEQTTSDLATGRLDWLRAELVHEDASTTCAALFRGRWSERLADAAAWASLEAWAARTYVPASLQSRIAGAGAGLSDND